MLDAAIHQFLLADAPLRAVVGNRIYPGFAEEDCAIPYVTVERIGRPENDMLDGSESEWAQVNYQFSVVAETTRQREAATIALRSRLRYSGPMDQYDVAIRILNEIDQTESPNDGSDRRYLLRIVDIEVLHALQAA